MRAPSVRIGVTFPQTEIELDPGSVREYAQTVENLGFEHIVAYDHVLGAEPRPQWSGPYTHQSRFLETLVLLGFIASCTRHIELMPSVIVLPQRQTALFAKQAATLDVLSGGRLRLAIGVGWNELEFEALGANFHDRGRRIEEQINLVRLLWQEEVVDFHGSYHRIDRAGLNPRPLRRSIPLWMGGGADVVMRRAARMADGWCARIYKGEDMGEKLSRFRSYVQEAGRAPGEVGIELHVKATPKGPEDWTAQLARVLAQHPSHFSFTTMGVGFTRLAQHLDAIERFRDLIASSSGSTAIVTT